MAIKYCEYCGKDISKEFKAKCYHHKICSVCRMNLKYASKETRARMIANKIYNTPSK